jgi:hypothetical protein
VYGGDPAKGIRPFGYPLPYMIVLNICFLMTVLCFLRAHFSDPGKMNVKDIGWPWDPTQPRVGKVRSYGRRREEGFCCSVD